MANALAYKRRGISRAAPGRARWWRSLYYAFHIPQYLFRIPMTLDTDMPDGPDSGHSLRRVSALSGCPDNMARTVSGQSEMCPETR
jgi:hypothetical protein